MAPKVYRRNDMVVAEQWTGKNLEGVVRGHEAGRPCGHCTSPQAHIHHFHTSSKREVPKPTFLLLGDYVVFDPFDGKPRRVINKEIFEESYTLDS